MCPLFCAVLCACALKIALYPHITGRSDVISTAKLEEALATLKGLSGEAKTQRIVGVLDEDHDGNINLDEIAEVWCVRACVQVV